VWITATIRKSVATILTYVSDVTFFFVKYQITSVLELVMIITIITFWRMPCIAIQRCWRCSHSEQSGIGIKTSRAYWLEAEHSIECITHAGHSIAFLHLVTLWPWPWPLTFWPNINWWPRRTRDGLSLCKVLKFGQFQPFWCGVRTNRHTHTITESQTPLNALLPRLSSAWVKINV